MCGFAGYFGESHGSVSSSLLPRMLGRIAHRGPDQRGTYVGTNASLGSHRLRILDLEGGDQPFSSADGSTVVVYNGEIYNHQELRRKLEAAGRRFRTRSDTEVLIHLYAEHGIDFVKQLNGMFAFALLDIRRNELFLVRDRMGIKPLFYGQTDGLTYFASEINALKLVPGLCEKLNAKAASFFLSQTYCPQPHTAYENIRRLEAGHYLRLDGRGGLVDTSYYDINFGKKTEINRVEASERLVALLSQAVQQQLAADVSPSLSLSGGLDSTSILAIASAQGAKLESFTLTFANWGENEDGVASRWARFYNQKHQSVEMNDGDVLDEWLDQSRQFGEPMGSWITACQRRLAQKIAGSGYKMALSGAGGDELFCGYPTLGATLVARSYRRIPRRMRDHLVRYPINLMPAGSGAMPLSFKLKSFVNAVTPCDVRTFLNFKAVIPFSDLSQLLTPEAFRWVAEHDPVDCYLPLLRHTEGWHLIDQLQYLDIKNFLEGSVLAHGDSSSMGASVEERVPFLDNELVDFAASLPVDVKFSLMTPKRLFRDALRNYLEKSGAAGLLKGYQKRGFWMPDAEWLRTGPRLGAYVRDRLAPAAVARSGFFQPAAVAKLYADHMARRRNNERPIQAILGMMNFLEDRM